MPDSSSAARARRTKTRYIGASRPLAASKALNPYCAASQIMSAISVFTIIRDHLEMA